jgi:hypothetical protein
MSTKKFFGYLFCTIGIGGMLFSGGCTLLFLEAMGWTVWVFGGIGFVFFYTVFSISLTIFFNR